jgi:hypothetical protein
LQPPQHLGPCLRVPFDGEAAFNRGVLDPFPPSFKDVVSDGAGILDA